MTPTLDPTTCYQALRARDGRFDGRFFVGVTSTGIYCRPICPARTPRAEHCAFFRNAAAAEKSGYRPCLRCRPELAPGNAQVDAVSALAARAASRIEDGALDEGDVGALAAELGVTARHLRRVVQQEFGVSPVALAQSRRLLLAKRLLTDTRLPVTEVAFASGFRSLRRFQALFLERYRLNPSRLRREGASAASATLHCALAYRPPLAWEALVAFLAARATAGVEEVADGCYRRSVALGRHRGWVAVTPGAGARPLLHVELSASLAPVLPGVIARVKQLFDLGADPALIAERLGALAAAHPGLRVPGAWEGFEVALRAILGQQISVRAATTLAGRLAQQAGQPIETPFAAIHRLAPSAAHLSQSAPEALTALGIAPARARAIVALAQAVAQGTLELSPRADVAATLEQLQALPGIGAWTAHYIAMRALAWPDAFPHADLGLRQALGAATPRELLARADAWRPWRAYAAMHLWQQLA